MDNSFRQQESEAQLLGGILASLQIFGDMLHSWLVSFS
jgi:hypothetical protein